MSGSGAGLVLPFAHLNLRLNPFGEPPLEERGRLAVVYVDELVEPLRGERHAVLVVGDSGRGKTTHLLALRQHFSDAPYYHIGEGESPPDFATAPLLFIDELQRVSRWRRFRLLRRRGLSLVIGSHEDHTRELQRSGWTVHLIEVGGASPDLLVTIVARRIEWARRGPGPVPQVGVATARILLERHGDDLRAIEGSLYEVFQQLEEIGDVEV